MAADPTTHHPKIGLVLSGGGARGVAHIGVLKVLEAMHIPVDYIVGTSMGSIVAGAYAMGNHPAELERKLAAVEWDAILADKPPRDTRSAFTRANERADIFSREVGFRDMEIQVPKGLNYGQQIEFFFNTLALKTGEVANFDDFDIPFRAVATDIENGQMVVLDQGGIAKAMRASMSVPGIFAPVEIDGRALLDGGLVRNLPVDVARAMGAEVIIAVNLGTALLKRDKIVSVFGVGQQMLNILTEQNVQTSLKELTGRDILISPLLGDFSASDFEHATQTIAIGEAAARAAAPKLRLLSLSEADYQAHLALRDARHPNAGQVNAVRIDSRGLKAVSVESVASQVSLKSGTVFTPEQLQENLNRLYASGDFQNVNHRFEQNDAGRTLVIEPVEKEWGPNYLQGGFRLSTDLSGDSNFSVLLSHRSKWLTASGLEWRNQVSIGQIGSLTSQLYQPLTNAGDWFVAPVVRIAQTKDDLFLNDRAVATYRMRRDTVGVDLGRNFGNATTITVGLERGTASADPSVAVTPFPNQRSRLSVVRLDYVQDRFDNWAFPKSGTYSFANVRISSKGLGASSNYQRLEAGAETAWGTMDDRFAIGLRSGRAWGNEVPAFELFTLGGFLALSGFQERQYIGSGSAFSKIVYAHRASTLGLKETYFGTSLEAGKIFTRMNGAPFSGPRVSATVFGAAGTPFGPFTMALGFGEGGSRAVYLFLGKP